MTTHVSIKFDDITSAKDLDSFFTQIWSQDKRVKVVLDVTECKKISLGRILSMKSVLDEHRYSSRKYIDHTVVIVNSGFARFILRAGLSIIRTERPVYIKDSKHFKTNGISHRTHSNSKDFSKVSSNKEEV